MKDKKSEPIDWAVRNGSRFQYPISLKKKLNLGLKQ